MKKRFVLLGMLIIMLALVGCSTTRYDSEYVRDANWTSDGKIVYLVEKKSTWVQKNPIYEQEIRNSTVVRLWECDSDGSDKREIGEIDSCEAGISYYGMSSVGNKIVISISDTVNTTPYTVEIVPALFVMNRNGSGLAKIGTKGFYPSISPDGSKIVYKEWGGGIRMMNIDGSNDHVFLDDTSLTSPQWSPDGEYISTNQNNLRLKIYDVNGIVNKVLDTGNISNDTIKYSLYKGYCWDTEENNAIYIAAWFVNGDKDKRAKIIFNNINDSLSISYFNFLGYNFKVNKSKVISEGTDWFVCDINGNNLWWLIP